MNSQRFTQILALIFSLPKVFETKALTLTLSAQSKTMPSSSTRCRKYLLTPKSVLILGSIVYILMAILSANSPVSAHSTAKLRTKRSLYELADGAEPIVGHKIKTSFSCNNLGYGYYADTDNECKIFHICQSFRMSDGSIYSNHYSFFCGNQTIFNQATLSCSHPDDSVPCESAKDFYHVNDYFGDVNSPSIKESDLSLANNLVMRAYGSRV